MQATEQRFGRPSRQTPEAPQPRGESNDLVALVTLYFRGLVGGFRGFTKNPGMMAGLGFYLGLSVANYATSGAVLVAYDALIATVQAELAAPARVEHVIVAAVLLFAAMVPRTTRKHER